MIKKSRFYGLSGQRLMLQSMLVSTGIIQNQFPPPHNIVGVWECERFIGVVLFSRGASQHLLKPFGLEQTEGCELTRIALSNHRSFVSQIMVIAIAFLRRKNLGLRLIVSFADPEQGHHGGIYQATNWVYSGTSAKSTVYIDANNRKWHSRMVKKSGVTTVYGKTRKVVTPEECVKVQCEGKHRYLFPLDKAMKKQIAPLAKPYPKREVKPDA
jgi:hypothetical protein